MKVRFKKLDEKAITPSYAKPGDAGMDFTAISKEYDDFGNIVYGTGIALEIPEGHVGLLFPRSSVFKKSIILANSVGVIDSAYRGEIIFKYKYLYYLQEYNIGDRIGQLIIIPYPTIELEESDILSETMRGEGGFGHTGK